MMCYAVGDLELFDKLYNVENVCMTIYQARLENVSSANMTVTNLYDWAENTLKPIAKLAYKDKGEFKKREHCQFCKVKTTCRKRAE